MQHETGKANWTYSNGTRLCPSGAIVIFGDRAFKRHCQAILHLSYKHCFKWCYQDCILCARTLPAQKVHNEMEFLTSPARIVFKLSPMA